MKILHIVQVLVLASRLTNVFTEEEHEDTSGKANSEEEYEYQEYSAEESNITQEDENLGGEHNIIGGKQINSAKEVPFIAFIKVIGWCTGSLISPKWVVTAAHCTQMIKLDDDFYIRSCIHQTQQGKPFSNGKVSFKCKLLDDQSIEYSEISKPCKIWLGLKDKQYLEREEYKGNTYPVKRIIRHKNTYTGFSSKPYQGYDISLIELERETERLYACLPSPEFNDNVVSKTAGYGMYHRQDKFSRQDLCQTDGSGQMRYHYCKEKGHGTVVCRHTFPPQSKYCERLLNHLNVGTYIDPVTKKEQRKEVLFISKHGNELKARLSCFDTKIYNEHGWCYTENNYYESKNTINDRNNWGYCSNDCYQRKDIAVAGILRVKDNMNVLNDKLCDFYLQWSLADKNVVIPKVLCVGYKLKIEAEMYLKESNLDINKTNLTKLTSQNLFGLHYADMLGKGFYVTAGGLCRGDSGGPLYVQRTDGGVSRYILTGVVSGGKGDAGNCGGTNNPTHFVRVKKFTKWIEGHIEDTCRE